MVFIILIIEIFNVLMFILGAKVTQQIMNKEEVKMPNPVKTTIKHIEEHRESKEEKQRQKEIEIMLENIDNYDGTSAGQKDI